MFKILYTTAGCSPKPNISSQTRNLLIYASKSNIIVANDTGIIKTIIRNRDETITFLYIHSNTQNELENDIQKFLENNIPNVTKSKLQNDYKKNIQNDTQNKPRNDLENELRNKTRNDTENKTRNDIKNQSQNDTQKNDILSNEIQNDTLVLCDVVGNISVYTIRLTKETKHTEITLEYTLKTYEYLVAVAMSNDNRRTFIAATVSKLMIYEDDMLKNEKECNELISYIHQVGFNDNEYVLVGFDSGCLQMLEFNDNLSVIAEVQAHKNGIKCIKSIKDGENILFLTSSLDRTIKIWKIYENNKQIGFECVNILIGHKDWVFGCNWININMIISSSSDNTICVWKYNGTTWTLDRKYGGLIEKVQTFYNAMFINGSVIGQSITGGFYKYNREGELSYYISGHTEEITSLDFLKDLILTASLDHTARIFSLELQEEVARPQIHGYPVVAARFIEANNMQYISGAQESIMRVYEGTELFLRSYTDNLNNKMFPRSEKTIIKTNYFDCKKYPKMAKQSELSLSNEITEDNFEKILSEGNNERNLSLRFLFAERHKIYGHYFDTNDIQVSKDFIVSCNKASSRQWAGVFVWNRKYDKVDYIKVHDLGIQKLKFSQDGKYFAAASRDKKLSLYRKEEGRFYLLRVFEDHKRIVWDCDFSRENKYVASCSRDRKIFVYNLESGEKFDVVEFSTEVTSISFNTKDDLLAFGLADGFVGVLKIEKDCLREIYRERLHSGTVKVLLFRKDSAILASGGSDGLLRVIEIAKK